MQHSDETSRIREIYRKRASELPPERYSLLNPGHLFMVQGLQRSVAQALRMQFGLGLGGLHMLDIGCGTGDHLEYFAALGADPAKLAGVDIIRDRIDRARGRNPLIQYAVADATRLPFPNAWFDIVSQFVVFTSILQPEIKATIAAEMLRVLKPGGMIIWYDFRVNNPRNADVKAIRDDEVRQLFNGARVKLQRVTLAPPIARCLAPISHAACAALEAIPIFRTHLFGTIFKNQVIA